MSQSQLAPDQSYVSRRRQLVVLARRSVARTLRRPAAWVPPVIFPIMLLAVNTGGLASATRIPNFPADSFLDFALVVTFMQAALFATSSSGMSIAHDIETGFMDRLTLTPMRASTLIVAQLAGSIVLSFGAAIIYILIGAVFGVTFEAGPLGVLVLFVLAVWSAAAFAAAGAWISLKSGDSEAMQGIFPLFFATLFLSTMNMPRELITADWFRAIVTINPVSYLVDGMRSLVITGWEPAVLLEAVAVLVLLSAFVAFGCSRALRRRLASA